MTETDTNMGGGGGGVEIDSSEPTTKTAGMLWVDTDSNKTFRRNDANDAWINLQYVDDGIVLDASTTFSNFTVPSAVTSVSSTKADAYYTVQGTSGNTFSVTGTASSAATGARSLQNLFGADHAAIGKTFIGVKAYTKTNDTGNYFMYWCKGSGNTGGSNKTISISASTSGPTLNTSSTFAAVTIEAGDKFQFGTSTSLITNYSKGTTGTITGSTLQNFVYDAGGSGGTGSYGNCGGASEGSPTSGGLYLEILQTFASSNLTTASQTMVWESNAETNPNCVLDWGALKDFGQVALYLSSETTETQLLIQVSADASDWTTVRTINVDQLTENATNYIRFNLINARYIRIYGNSGESKVLACRADARINTGFGDHEHVDISSTDTTLPSDGT